MAFFEDFGDAVESYLATYVTLSIVAGNVQTGTGGSVNVNEVWRFQVHVVNGGMLNMTGVSLQIKGLNGAEVSTAAAGPFSSTVIFGALTVNAHDSSNTLHLFFKAPNAAQPAGTSLVNARINSFDANLTHILKDHSGGGAYSLESFSAQVFP